MADQSSSFRERLKEDKLKHEQLRLAIEEAAKRREQEEATARSTWPSVRAALERAKDSINRDFAIESMSNRFDLEPSKSTDDWPVIERLDLVHRGGHGPRAHWSIVVIEGWLDGKMKVRGVVNSVNREWKLADTTEAAWRELLEEIFDKDTRPR